MSSSSDETERRNRGRLERMLDLSIPSSDQDSESLALADLEWLIEFDRLTANEAGGEIATLLRCAREIVERRVIDRLGSEAGSDRMFDAAIEAYRTGLCSAMRLSPMLSALEGAVVRRFRRIADRSAYEDLILSFGHPASGRFRSRPGIDAAIRCVLASGKPRVDPRGAPLAWGWIDGQGRDGSPGPLDDLHRMRGNPTVASLRDAQPTTKDP